MNIVTLNWLEVISGIFGILSFLFAVVVFVIDRGLKRHLESGLISLIGTLDTSALMGASPKHDKRDLALYAEVARNQAIGLLRSFSKSNHRYETYNFGIAGRDVKEVVENRRVATGVLGGRSGGGSCLVGGQKVLTPNGPLKIEDVRPGSEIICFQAGSGKSLGVVVDKATHTANSCLLINGQLSLTETNLILTKEAGWIDAGSLTTEQSILSEDAVWTKISSLVHQRGEFLVHALKTSGENYFASGFLVHNKLD